MKDYRRKYKVVAFKEQLCIFKNLFKIKSCLLNLKDVCFCEYLTVKIIYI
jgi:hypothetical protein